ncbi:MAG: nickel pincer cofactor biosynthesis protein LarB [Dehalococcoidia bacterium]|nr:MAG: nickel pincer cofactor biosynthesis protein LarB [Dehalococcoidia bacterium]
MEEHRLRELLAAVADGRTGVDAAVGELRHLPYEDIGFALVDHHRALRDWVPEVILGQGKSPDQVVAIARTLLERSDRLLITRLEREAAAAVLDAIPDARHHEVARCITVERTPAPKQDGIAVLCAGTADLPVAEEAAVTAEIIGNDVRRLYDVGVAGLHRLLDRLDVLRAARALVVVAGMEGALPSVVAGLVSAPVIAVPTSVGYGASFGGLAPLLSMLNACAAGVAVVNIDNGFGAGYMAASINRIALAQRPD